MCGIVGVIFATPPTNEYPLARMRDELRHRGPDDAGEWWSGNRQVGFAHRRLSIIDTSSAGHQPMVSRSGRTVIVFNGEIYNYLELRAELAKLGRSFQTRTDTEVILEAYECWGMEAFARLNGMFAMALHDSATRTVVLARDRAGEKPLFLGRFGHRVVFASELKALLVDPDAPRVMDRNALEFYLAYGYVPGSGCLLQGFEKLPPASLLTIRLDDLQSESSHFWRLPSPPTESKAVPDLLDRFEHLLEESVRRQLVADVPVCVLLSGGLDSSLVTAMAARVSSRPVQTFTVTFPGHVGHDEGPAARLVAQHFGTDHRELPVDALAFDVLPDLVKQYDEPIADSAIVPTYLISKVIREYATVALGGDGGDELFGGYPHYQWIWSLEQARRWIPGVAREFVAAASGFLPAGTRGRNHMLGVGADAGRSIGHINLYFDRRLRCALLRPLGPPSKSAVVPEAWRAGLAAGIADVRDRAMRTDFLSTMVDGYLVKTDRASMRSSLELRAPWLSPDLLEFAYGEVPAELKVTRRAKKILTKMLAKRVLPPEFDLHRKQGFTMPLGAWLDRGWRRLFKDALDDARDLFDRDAVARLIERQSRSRANTQRLFALSMLAMWRREYRVGLP